jgi:hypothetical protein
MLEVDIPEVLAELTAIFETYEKALVTNDIATLNSLFWDSPATVRFGSRDVERQYGHAEIAEFRTKRGAVNAERTLQNQRITTFGRDFGIANTEYRTPGLDKIGRQSQTWMRTTNGWKIVAAHISYGA